MGFWCLWGMWGGKRRYSMSEKNGGEDFDLLQDDLILKINSPRNSVNTHKVVYKNIEERWVIVALRWDGLPRLGIRWFWDTNGMPNSHGYSTWFLIPPSLNENILNALPLDISLKKEIIIFLENNQ